MSGERRGDVDWERRLFTRRRFVLGASGLISGLASADAIARGLFTTSASTPVTYPPAGLINPGQVSSIKFLLTRREDFLFIQVDGFNVKREGNFLVPGASASALSTLLFTFPPQSMVEAAVLAGKAAPKPGSSPALLSGPSRLGFTLNGSSAGFKIPYTVAGLLDWYDDQMNRLVVPVASDPQSFSYTPQLQAPDAQTTAIEMPWNVVISPTDQPNNWSHEVTANLNNGSYELWRTRLTSGDGDAVPPYGHLEVAPGDPTFPDGNAPIRAVWNFDIKGFNGVTATPTLPANLSSPGAPPSTTDPRFPFTEASNPQDRWNLVMATSDFDLMTPATDGSSGYSSDITTRRLWLSARGGFADWEGAWQQTSLASWHQITTLGRDQFTRIVDRGFLFPWGHRATLTTTTERTFQTVASGGSATEAVLQQTEYLTVLQDTVDYDRYDLPFTSIRAVTLRTPDITTPEFSNVASNPREILADGQTFRFHFVGTDYAGREISFSAGAWFVPDPTLTKVNPNGTPGPVIYALNTADARQVYNATVDPTDPLRLSDFGGQAVAFVPATAEKPGNTDSHVMSVSFGAGPAVAVNGGPDFAPSLAIETSDVDPHTNTPGTYTNAQAIIRLAAAEQLSGGGALGNNPTPAFAYHTAYVQNGFDGAANKGEVYLATAAVPAAGSDPGNALAGRAGSQLSHLVYGNGASGGLSTPNLQIEGLSRTLGPIADPDGIASGTLDPSKFFGALESAQFLGGLSLGDVIAVVGDFTGSVSSNLRRAPAERAHDVSGGSGPQVPQISYVTSTGPAPNNDPLLVTTVTWSPPFASTDPSSDYQNPANQWFTRGSNFGATLTGVITTDLVDKTQSTYQFTGVLDDFTFTLIGSAVPLIAISFDKLSFSSGKGKKTSVTPSGLSAEFLGPLEFLNDLQDLISTFSDFDGSGGGSGASISVTPAGVLAELSVAIPPVELTIFTLSGISFAAIATIPLDGVSMATFEFDFASPNDPFTVGGGIFGGGGYFQIVVGTKHVRSLTISLDFEALVALNIADIASGSVQLEAGFTYVLQESGGDQGFTLTGFVQLSGNLDILGLIKLSLTFLLQLAYQEDKTRQISTLTGTATLTISISLFCFTLPVSMTVQKTFDGPALNAQTSTQALKHTSGLQAAAPTFINQFSSAGTSDGSYFLTYVQAFETQ